MAKHKMDKSKIKKLSIELSPELHKALKDYCNRERYFINGVIVELIEKMLEQEGK